jgi:N-acetyl-anhydromuramyl-L-alanine amidase AmpD
MNITNCNFNWNGSFTPRNRTEYIILHHRAGDGDVQSIHDGHIKNGWTGIGYHFYVRKDGGVYSGRPLQTVGAHCTNYNSKSIGICFEGNFEKETMTASQIRAGQELISYLRELYPSAQIKKHKDFNSTACPGKNFPFDAIKSGLPKEVSQMTTDEAIQIIKSKAGLSQDTITFLLCYKYGEELLVKIAKAMN